MAKKTAPEAGSTPWDQIEIGDQVKHPKWGVGTVLFRSGSGETAKAIVVFPEEGQKKLMLRYAGLTKVGSTSLRSVEKLKAEAEKGEMKPTPAVIAPHADEDADEVELAIDDQADDEDDSDDEEDVAGFDDEDDDLPAKRGRGGDGEDEE